VCFKQFDGASSEIVAADAAGNTHVDPRATEACGAAGKVRRRAAKVSAVGKNIPKNLT
jgi:hypothetical protein